VTATLAGGLLIGDDRIIESSGGTYVHIYPATGQPNAHIPLAGADEIDRAVASGWEAHREWMSLTVDRRRDLLTDLADAVHENLEWPGPAQRRRLRGANLLRRQRDPA